MSAYLELQRDGRLGPAGAEMLYRVAGAAARHGRFRPDEGEVWDGDAVHRLAADFLTEGGSKRLSALLLRATNDESLERLLFRSVTNHLRDRDRREGSGPLLRSLMDAAAAHDNDLEVVSTPAGRALSRPGVHSEPWTGGIAPLVRAAFDVTDVKIIRWRNSVRRSPVAERQSLVAVMAAVIDAANSAVPLSVMIEVVQHRFNLTGPPDLVDLDDEPGLPASGAVSPAILASASEAAVLIFDQLSDRERWTLHLYEEDTTVRELADILGVSKSTAANTVSRLRSVLASVLGEDPEAEAVLQVLGDLVDDWTRSAGAASVLGTPLDEQGSHGPHV